MTNYKVGKGTNYAEDSEFFSTGDVNEGEICFQIDESLNYDFGQGYYVWAQLENGFYT